MGKYRSLGTGFDKTFRNDLNANFDEIDKDIKAETTRAKQREDNIQAQVNTLVVNGDSSPAAAQAAVDAKGVDKGNLKQRLDDDYNELSSRLANKAEKQYMDEQLGLKAEKQYTDEQLGLKRNKSDKLHKADYDLSQDANHWSINDFDEETRTIIQGLEPGQVNAVLGQGNVLEENHASGGVSTRALKDKDVTRDKIDAYSIVEDNLSFPILTVPKSKNLLNKSTFIKGEYVNANTGGLLFNSDFSLTPFIPVNPSTTYVYNRNENIAFYDKDKKFISGIARVFPDGPLFIKFTTPANARFVRVSIRNLYENVSQLELGEMPTAIEEFNTTIDINDYLAETKQFDLLEHLQNPFVRTQIKLVGSSSTAGFGGTGYSPTGEFMFTDRNGEAKYANVETAYCWGNELKRFLEREYNREFYVDANHPHVKAKAFDGTYGMSEGSLSHFRWRFANQINNYDLLEVDFYGDSITVLYYMANNTGKFDVYVDDVLKATVDTYSETTTHNVEQVISGLTLTDHKLTIKGRTDRNINSTDNPVFIQGFKIRKHVEVKNWGISGTNSYHLLVEGQRWVESADNFVLLQMGSNDRSKLGDDVTRTNQTDFINYCKKLGKKVYILSFSPASVAYDNMTAHRMDEINRRLADIAAKNKCPFIDIYHEFLNYTHYTGKTLESLMTDDLHCNDDGYELMLRIITQKLGLSLNRVDLGV